MKTDYDTDINKMKIYSDNKQVNYTCDKCSNFTVEDHLNILDNTTNIEFKILTSEIETDEFCKKMNLQIKIEPNHTIFSSYNLFALKGTMCFAYTRGM